MVDYPKPSVTVDILIFSIQENKLKILLVKRGLEPFKDFWALPGGFVKMNESIDDAARRELKEETGAGDIYLEQLYTFGDVKRDPRGRVITVAYYALANSEKIKLAASSDVNDARWYDVNNLPKLAFDHSSILDYALKRLRWKFEYSNVAFSLLEEKFTLTQVQNIYEIVFNKKFDKRNFRKKILSLDILKKEKVMQNVSHRPPTLYSLKSKPGKIIEILKPQD